MKKIFLLLAFSIGVLSVKAQNGIEDIIVEKYYVSNGNDTLANADGGKLPVGSVTYRIYVDLLPGYRFQAAYGIPGHELRIATTTLFFNNEDRGDTYPSYTKAQAKSNTVMLDSWLSVGAACVGNFGIPKDEDDDSSATVVNNYSPQVLQNDDPSCGIPVKDQDGLVAGTPGILTAVGIGTEMAIFGSQNDGTNGPVFSTFNGSWACLGGSVGPDSLTNKVLIAQLTTNGRLSFALNIQIGTPSGGVENYVASNPTGLEISIPGLTYLSPLDTTASLSATEINEIELLTFPNPASDVVMLRLAGGEEKDQSGVLKITSLSGAVVFEKNILLSVGSNYQLSTNEFSKGFYLVNFQTEHKSFKAKVIVQ
jgi:hypothetical protein